jgi:hypothetical protein
LYKKIIQCAADTRRNITREMMDKKNKKQIEIIGTAHA